MNPRAMRAACIVLVLVAILLSTPRASAGSMGRYTILGKVFRRLAAWRIWASRPKRGRRRSVCCESCACPGGKELYHVVLEGGAEKTIPVKLEGNTAGERSLEISGTADYWDFYIICSECKLPVDLPAR